MKYIRVYRFVSCAIGFYGVGVVEYHRFYNAFPLLFLLSSYGSAHHCAHTTILDMFLASAVDILPIDHNLLWPSFFCLLQIQGKR